MINDENETFVGVNKNKTEKDEYQKKLDDARFRNSSKTNRKRWQSNKPKDIESLVQSMKMDAQALELQRKDKVIKQMKRDFDKEKQQLQATLKGGQSFLSDATSKLYFDTKDTLGERLSQRRATRSFR